MPKGLKRFYGAEYLHFITSSCYRRRALLQSAARRDLFLQTLEQVRCRYGFAVVGYVVMPEHIHLLIGEPEKGDPSVVMQVLKQRFASQVLQARSQTAPGGLGDGMEEGHFWQRRFYDFVVWSEAKLVEKLRYMHRNPVKRGLVLRPEEWAWSSFRYYACDEAGPVLVNQLRRAELKIPTESAVEKPRHKTG
ncbi:MAG: transposase [Terriglobales bacterium]